MEREQIKKSIGTITESIPISGGLIHEIDRLYDGTQYFFLKKRSSSFVKVEGIVAHESDIVYEYNVLEFFHKEFPDLFPKPLTVDAEEGTLLMTDALVGGRQLIEQLAENNSEQILQITNQLGEVLGNIHSYSKGKTGEVTCNPNNDFSEILNFRYGYQNINSLTELVEDLRKNKDHILLGGLSAKNILTNSDRVAFVDLETACAGDPIFDYAFCIAHILLHYIENPVFGMQLLEVYEAAYHSSIDLRFDLSQVGILILGTFLYRLDNSRVPYSLNITSDHHRRIIEEIRSRLEKGHIEKSDLFQFI